MRNKNFNLFYDNELGLEGNFLDLIKSIWNPQPIAYTMVENFNAFPLDLEEGKKCPLLPLWAHTALEVPARTTRPRNEMNTIQIGKEGLKLPLFTGDTLYIKILWNPLRNYENKRVQQFYRI